MPRYKNFIVKKLFDNAYIIFIVTGKQNKAMKGVIDIK